VLFNKDKTVAMMANKESLAIELLDKIKIAYDQLPRWMQQGIKSDGWNKKKLELENGSRIIAAATSSSALTGYTINLLYLDEFAKIPQYVANDFIASVYPVVTSGKSSKIIMVSCVTDDTFIFTNNGIRQVKNFINYNKEKGYVVDNYRIVGKDGINDGKLMFNNGKAFTRIIDTTFGKLECSVNHKLWACKNGVYDWFKSEELDIGDYVSVKYGMNIWGNDNYIGFKSEPSTKGKTIFNYEYIDKKLAYFLGLFLAEGSVYKKYNKKNGNLIGGIITISCGDDISGIIKELGLHYYYDGKFHYNICSKDLILLLEKLGFDLNLHAKDKIFPDKLLSMSKENIIAMLSGYFDGDGSSHKNRGIVSVCSSSKKMLLQIKMMLLNLGILSDYFENITKPTKKVKVFSNRYSLAMSKEYSEKFYKEIGFGLKRKQDNRNNLCLKKISRNSYDIIPFAKEIIKKYYYKEIRKLNLFKGGNGNKQFSRNSLLKLKDKIKSLEIKELNIFLDDNVQEDLRWYKIRDIKESENLVYDFSLNDDENNKWCHSVLYNGIVGHQTPLGLNHFYNFWIGATRTDGNENSFYPISVNWWDIPGRDEKFKKKIIKDIGLQRWEQEYSCKFLGSNSTLIDSDILERIVYKIPIMTKWNGLLSIYENPIPGKEYVLGVDVSKGTQRDSSMVQVLRIDNQKSLKQVATYRNNQIIPHDFAQVCVSIAKYYNNAHMMVENNDIGHSVCDTVWHELEYEELVNLDPKALGVRSTKRSKKIANMLLKEYMEKNWLEIVDERTVYELSRYEEIKLGVFAAGRHEHDDAVTSLLWALFFVKSDAYEGVDYSFNQIEKEYNVEYGEWETEEVQNINETEEQGDPRFIPSVFFDDDTM